MKIRRNGVITGFIALAIISTATVAFAAVPFRGSSRNGVDSGAPSWLLLGRTVKATLTKNGKSVTMSQEVVCPDQDVEASLSNPTPNLSGSCDSGVYLFIFQFQSSSTNVNLKFKGLPNFTPDQSSLNYGVMVCDNSDLNSIEMCTNDPTGSTIPDITFSVVATHAVNFLVPSFPTFKPGTAQQGRGLTLFILTQQDGALPIHFIIPEVD
ncbi:MAG: hypothetical protein WB952_16640 [Terriglobales bacterium]